MAAISGKHGRVRFTSATATSSTNNAADLSTDGVTLTIDSTAKRLWDRSNTTALHVYGGSTEISSTDYKVTSWVLGTVAFTTPRSTAVSYTVDVETLSASFLGNVRGWSVDVSVDMQDITTLSTTTADSQWRTFTPGLSQANATLDRLFTASTAFFAGDRLVTGQDVVLELVMDGTTGDRFMGYGYISADSFDDPVDGVLGESIDVQIDGTLSYTTL
jgi:hypothetical protein